MKEKEKPAIDLRRVFVSAAFISLVLCYALLWLRMITTWKEYTGADFIAFYAAGRIARNEGAEYGYDLDLQRRYEQEVVGFEIAPEHISPYLHPPFILPIARLVSLDDFRLSFGLWNLVMIGFLAMGTIPWTSLFRAAFDRRQAALLVASVLLFYPSYVSIVNGQDSAILFFGGCLWLAGIVTRRDWMAGLGLAVLAVRPHLALPLALPFLFRQRKVWWWFLLGAVVLAGFSFFYAGWGGVEGFLRVLLVSGRGVNYHTGENNMLNLIGLLLRIFPGVQADILRWFGWGVYFAAIIFLCALWARTRQLTERELSLAVLLGLFTAPHFHFHDFVLLIVPVACLMLVLLKRGSPARQNVLLFPLVVSFILLFSYFADFLKESVCYFVMLFLGLAVWFPGRFFPSQPAAQEEAHEVVS
jgi:hypothetical protein